MNRSGFGEGSQEKALALGAPAGEALAAVLERDAVERQRGLIRRGPRHAGHGGTGHIIAKLNALVEPEIIRPMDEPCVRVPLSILKELRGQESGIEYSRRALVRTWSEDRRTGKAVEGA